ncbi:MULTISPECIES: S41 family peptidase [unclassified Ketobacter]|uniref:S41 family peptidase n=1 Tax=unclassified Ketobacter TaxID=2639109 RepID=UPI000F19446D|nr:MULTISPECIES: S41 family peptidase [unclassified Ketobacter]MCK5790051.1 S41 family peptidase [Ketobacter sp.]RLT89236.1 MAG: S41 family peptidase [Ketobacter sp. GenoA1]RLT95918.1 MAG: S41 family peptidase [Ketobacter sp.]
MGFRPSSYWRLIWQRSLLISLLAVSPVALSSEAPGQAEDEDVSAADTTQQQEQEQGLLPINELRTFADVFDRIKQAYVEEVDDKTLLENAIQGMLTELDPHSAYLKPEAYQDLQINTTGEFGGLGIEVGMEDGFVKVITPIDDTPAKKAGVEAGDLIIKLDSTPVKGLSLGEAVKLMRGKPGSDIVLTIIRAGIDKPLEITVTRAVIQVQSVRGRLLQKDYGYVRLSQFQINTGADMLKLLEKLRKENDADLKGLVLDLRNNPGGVLQAAVDVSDAFIDDGLVVYTQGRLPDSDMKFRAAPGDELKGVPIVVLVNGGSASASEIVAGALQDHSRAVIMGTTTFGKGSVQTVLPLHNNRALKLTTARYYTPGGRSIQAQGIEPDIVVENARLTRVEEMQRVKERDLSGHLENPEGEGETGAASDGKQALSDTDYQLYEALNLLKALNVIKRPATASAHQDNKRI